jgi:hypothetical protein
MYFSILFFLLHYVNSLLKIFSKNCPKIAHNYPFCVKRLYLKEKRVNSRFSTRLEKRLGFYRQVHCEARDFVFEVNEYELSLRVTFCGGFVKRDAAVLKVVFRAFYVVHANSDMSVRSSAYIVHQFYAFV